MKELLSPVEGGCQPTGVASLTPSIFFKFNLQFESPEIQINGIAPASQSYLPRPVPYSRMTAEKDAVITVAGLMALSARTSPKGKGIDTIHIQILTGKELKRLSKHLADLGETRNIGFFKRDAANIAASDVVVLIGTTGQKVAGVNCGACGFLSCAVMTAEFRNRDEVTTDFAGPNCAIRMTDLGIAIGSAVKTAQIHNVDNRIMFSAGVAAIDLGYLEKKCTVVYAIPLSASG